MATDGSFELDAIQSDLSEALPTTHVTPVLWKRDEYQFFWDPLVRFAAKVKQRAPADHSLPLLREYLKTPVSSWLISEWPDLKYHLVPLADECVGELLIVEDKSRHGTHCRAIAILLVRDEFVDAKDLWSGKIEGETATICVFGEPIVQDIDGDGRIEVGFEFQQNLDWLPYPPIRVKGDSRLWNCIYRVEAAGLKPYANANGALAEIIEPQIAAK